MRWRAGRRQRWIMRLDDVEGLTAEKRMLRSGREASRRPAVAVRCASLGAPRCPARPVRVFQRQ